MAEPNLVPRTNKGASIGTALKQWAHGFFGDVTIDGNKPLVDANNLGDVDDPAAARGNLNVFSKQGTLAHTNPRALAPWLSFSGQSGEWCSTHVGAKGNIQSGPFTLVFPLLLNAPTTVTTYGALSDLPASTAGTGSGVLQIRTEGSAITIRLYGTTSVNHRNWTTPSLSSYGVRWGYFTIVRSASGISAYLDQVPLPLAETAFGSAPSFDYPINSQWVHLVRTGRPPLFFNYAKTPAEIADLVRVGPTALDLAGGSMVPLLGPGKLNGDFEDTSGGGGGSPFADTYAGTAITVSVETVDTHSGSSCARIIGSGSPVTSVQNWLILGSTTDGNGYRIWSPGKRVRFQIWVKSISGSGSFFMSNGYSTLVTVPAAAAGEWTQVVWEGPVPALSNNRSYPVISASSGTWLVDDAEITYLGLITNSQITRTAQLRDSGPNKLHGVLTSGVTPIGGQMQPITWTQSATGYILGDNPLIHDPHIVSELWAKPTTATIPNVELRRDGPSGTVVVASESAGAEGEWTQLTTIDATAAGEAGDKYHLTFSTSADCEFRLVAQPL